MDSNTAYTWLATAILCIAAFAFDFLTFQPNSTTHVDIFLALTLFVFNMGAAIALIMVVCRVIIRQTFQEIAIDRWLNDFSEETTETNEVF